MYTRKTIIVSCQREIKFSEKKIQRITSFAFPPFSNIDKYNGWIIEYRFLSLCRQLKKRKAQNLLARVVTSPFRFCSSRTLLQQPHWLLIKHRKIANITFRTLHCSQPAYLRSSLHACHSTRSLRLSNTNLLSAPFVRTSFGSRSFNVAAFKIWNSLPLSLPTCTSTDTFRRHLKTHYCQQAFQST